MENLDESKIKWGVISTTGRFYPARDKVQAEKWAKYKYGTGLEHCNGTLATSETVMREPEHTVHVLTTRAVGMILINGILTPNAKRQLGLVNEPPWFVRMEGSYAEVSAEAERLNQVQIKANFMDWIYYPSPKVEDDDFAENMNLEASWKMPSYTDELHTDYMGFDDMEQEKAA